MKLCKQVKSRKTGKARDWLLEKIIEKLVVTGKSWTEWGKEIKCCWQRKRKINLIFLRNLKWTKCEIERRRIGFWERAREGERERKIEREREKAVWQVSVMKGRKMWSKMAWPAYNWWHLDGIRKMKQFLFNHFVKDWSRKSDLNQIS